MSYDMKYGFGFWHEDGDVPSILKQARKWKLDFAEISLDYPWPDKLSENEVLTAKEVLADAEIDAAFHGPLGGILLFHPRKEMVDAAVMIHEKCLRFAAILDPLYYTFHIKTHLLELRIEESRNTALQNCLDGLDKLIEIARELSIRLVVENSTSTGYLIPVEEMVSRDLDFNLDIGHWFAGKRGYDELRELVSNIEGRIPLLHLHDSKFQDAPTKDHLSLGQGDIDFSRVFSVLRNAGVRWVSLEVHPTAPNLAIENLSRARKLVALMEESNLMRHQT